MQLFGYRCVVVVNSELDSTSTAQYSMVGSGSCITGSLHGRGPERTNSAVRSDASPTHAIYHYHSV